MSPVTADSRPAMRLRRPPRSPWTPGAATAVRSGRAAPPVRPAFPRLLVLEGALRENGGLRVTHDIVRRWAADGVPVTLLVLENVAPDVPLLDPAPDVPWTFASADVRRFRTALPFVLFGLVKHTLRADVVVSSSEVGWQLLLGRLVTWALRRPFLTLVQAPLRQAVEDWRPARLRGAHYRVHRHVDQAICVSPGLVGQVVANGLDSERVHVVPVGIDVDDVVRRGRAAEVRRRADGEPPVLVAMGRLAAAKGFDVLIEASAKLRADGVPHRLRIVGEGPARPELAAAVARHGLQDVVDLVGFVSDPQPLLASADLFVLSSRHEGNGGLVLLEALAHGLPIIATDCETGPREVLQDGALGDLVPPEDPAALAAALAAHLADPGRLAAKAALGPTRARDFDQTASARNLLQHILRTVPVRFR